MLVNSKDIELFESYKKYISSTYPAFLTKLGLDRVAAKAEGAIITDSAGKMYIDCVGGYGLFNIGHNHIEVIQSLIDQLNKKQLFTKPFITDIQVTLAEALAKVTPGDLTCSFLCNSGSEAIDNAIKLARLHSGKKLIITANNSFHGYTYGALSASGISRFKRFFEPMVPEIANVRFGDTESLKASITEDTAAVLLEPIQHEAGITLPPKNYFKEVRRLCDEKQCILILDEIKTGCGKTGYMFACEHFGIVPDILVLGKALGGGLIPIGGLVAKKNLWKKFSMNFSMSASSFANNVLACRAALSTLEILKRDNIPEECRKKGLYLLEELKTLVIKFPALLKDVEGLGLLLGLKTDSPQNAIEIAQRMISQGVILFPAYGDPSVLMIEPPLIITYEQMQIILQSLYKACNTLTLKREGK